VLIGRRVRRLPGVRFEVQAPVLPDALPRMDVAVFVGVAASGPLHLPVAIEDPREFASIFGDDAPLAWDQAAGQPRRAYLAPAVRAFFRNGGRRCWVVRVAGPDATANHFPIAGLLERDDVSGDTRPAFAMARSEGSWSDGVQVAATLTARPVVMESGDLTFDGLSNITGAVLKLSLSAVADVVVGDLLRLSFDDVQLYLTIERIDNPDSSQPSLTRSAVTVRGGRPLWVRAGAPASVPSSGLVARLFAPDGSAASLPVFGAPRFKQNDVVELTIDVALKDAPPPGSPLRLDLPGNETLWMTVTSSRTAHDDDPDDYLRSELSGRALRLGPAPGPRSLDHAVVERLGFEMWVRQSAAPLTRLGGLGFAPDHPRYWRALPLDSELFGDPPRSDKDLRLDLRRLVTSPRFPLAGNGDAGQSYLPLAMPEVADSFLGAVVPPRHALERDGLAEFDERLFLDPALPRLQIEALNIEADFIRYQAAETGSTDPLAPPRKLRGIHAAMAVEEATLIAVPDAVHAGWQPAPPEQPAPPKAPDALPEPTRGLFVDCSLRPPPDAPILLGPHEVSPPITVTPNEPYTLRWEPPLADAEYVLEEATEPNWSDAAEIYRGDENQKLILGRPQGTYYYRVRVTAGGSTSAWSVGAVVPVRVDGGYTVVVGDGVAWRTAASVQRALLRMCAARGDLFAVLNLPWDAQDDEVLRHVARLKANSESDLGPLRVPALAVAETGALSYGALYHPWTVTLEQGELRNAPPDGVAVAVMARRSFERGCWVAPANEPIRDVLAVLPPVNRDNLPRLQEAQVNVILQDPRGFLALSADTLSDDPMLWPVNVRRLLHLLRRIALRAGNEWVFEPNGNALRRRVQRGLEAMLAKMYGRGAFAGATAADAYRVTVDDTVNPPESIDLGRLVVELRVAPSRPLEYLTVRLVQSGDRGAVTEGA
jgi:Phage tail sheath C-terminal domain